MKKPTIFFLIIFLFSHLHGKNVPECPFYPKSECKLFTLTVHNIAGKSVGNSFLKIEVKKQGGEFRELFGTTDINGNFRIYLPKKLKSLKIIFEDLDEINPPYYIWRYNNDLPERKFPNLNSTVKLPAAKKIGGVVKSDLGKPLVDVGVKVLIYHEGEIWEGLASIPKVETVTDKNGKWRTSCFAGEGNKLNLDIRKKGYESVNIYCSTGKDDLRWQALKKSKLASKLKKLYEVSCEVLDDNGNPIDKAWVWAVNWTNGKGQTDEKGKVKICIPELPKDFYAYKQRYALQKQKVTKANKEKKAEIVFQLLTGERVTGKVTDNQGKAVAGAKLTSFDLISEVKPQLETFTNEQGEFTIEALPNKKTISYGIEKEGFNHKYSKLSTTRARKPIVLTRKLHLTGTVTDIDTGQPLQGMKLCVNADVDEYYNETQYQDHGEGIFRTYFYYYEPEQTRKLFITASIPGYQVWKKCLIQAPETFKLNIDIKLKKVKPLILNVTDPDGKPVKQLFALIPNKGEFYFDGANIISDIERIEENNEIEDIEYRDVLDNINCLLKTKLTSTGTIELPAAPKKSAVIMFNKNGYFIAPFEEVAEKTNVQLHPWLELKGNWSNEGVPANGTYLYMSFKKKIKVGNVKLELEDQVKVDLEGNFHAKNLIPGKYFFRSSRYKKGIECAGIVNISKTTPPININGVAIDSQKKTVKFKVQVKDCSDIVFEDLYNFSDEFKFTFDPSDSNSDHGYFGHSMRFDSRAYVTVVNKNDVLVTGFFNTGKYNLIFDGFGCYTKLNIKPDSPDLIDIGTIKIPNSIIPVSFSAKTAKFAYGTVFNPDGKAAAKSKIIISASLPRYLDDGFTNGMNNEILEHETDQHGKFRFKIPLRKKSFVVFQNDHGCAAMSIEELKKNQIIKLQKWGKLVLDCSAWSQFDISQVHIRTKAVLRDFVLDKDGLIKIEKVFPGEGSFYLQRDLNNHMLSMQYMVGLFFVAPGETTDLKLKKGIDVSAKIEINDLEARRKKIKMKGDWQEDIGFNIKLAYLTDLPLQYLPKEWANMDDAEREKWFEKFSRNKENKILLAKRNIINRPMMVVNKKKEIFLNNILPGAYKIDVFCSFLNHIEIEEKNYDNVIDSLPAGRLEYYFHITPEMVERNKPVELPPLKVKSILTPVPGDIAPDFKFQDIDGEIGTNKNFKGKYLLIIPGWDFWLKDKDGIKELKELYLKIFKGRTDAKMIGLIGGNKIQEKSGFEIIKSTVFRDASPKGEKDFEHCFGGKDFIYFIGPDGKVIAFAYDLDELDMTLKKYLK